MFQNLKSWLKKFTRNFSFHMTVGKFGMWITKTRRALQLCYAYWNKDFRLKHQFYPNPDYCTLRVTGQVTREMILTFTHPEKKIQLIKDLFRINGIKRVIPEPYEIKVEKESDFNWQKILPEAEKIIIKHLVKK
jgi:hypothetical protein